MWPIERETEPVGPETRLRLGLPRRSCSNERRERSIDRAPRLNQRSGRVIRNILSNICSLFQFQIRSGAVTTFCGVSPSRQPRTRINRDSLLLPFLFTLSLPLNPPLLHEFVRIIRGSRAAICHAQIQEFAPSRMDPKKGGREKRGGGRRGRTFPLFPYQTAPHLLSPSSLRVWNSLEQRSPLTLLRQ